MEEYGALVFTEEFILSLLNGRFQAGERAAIMKALALLNEQDRRKGLRVHPLRGRRDGTWSASASDNLRIIFVPGPGGKRILISCSRHYDD